MAKEKEVKGKNVCETKGTCHRCWGGMLLVLGVLIVLNDLWAMLSWGMFIGVIVALKGLIKLLMPYCTHCK